MTRLLWTASIIVTGLLPFCAGLTYADEGPGVLHAEFVYSENLDANLRTKGICTEPGGKAVGAAMATDIVVNLAGKLAESVINAAAAKTQPEATTLETVVPLDGFYGAKDIAVDGGCLIFHNGVDASGNGASVKGVFQVAVSEDSSAFRLTVIEWQFLRFLKPQTSHWWQKSDVRDFVLKIEFLGPGEEGLGRRSVFVEHPFMAVDRMTLAGAFSPGQKLPWFAAPKPPSGTPAGLTLPLNVRITLIETTKPNQLAIWAQEVAKEKKTDLVDLVKNAVKKSVDPNYEASENAKLAESAGSAYSAYKTGWDALSVLYAGKPADLPAGASAAAAAAHDAGLKAWQAAVMVAKQTTEAKRVAAKLSFSAAGLPWPGDLPAFSL